MSRIDVKKRLRMNAASTGSVTFTTTSATSCAQPYRAGVWKITDSLPLGRPWMISTGYVTTWPGVM